MFTCCFVYKSTNRSRAVSITLGQDVNHNMSTAVIGCGYWGKNYVRIVSSLNRCGWAIDESKQARVAIARKHGVKCAAQVSPAIADPDVTSVIIATPAGTHFDLVRTALLAGKHVLVEKPLTLESGTSKELANLAERLGLTLMVGHTFLFNSRLWKLISITQDAKQFGELRYITCKRTNLGPVRDDCSVLWDLAPHDVSIIQALKKGMLPESVSATGASVLQSSAFFDVAFVTITYPDGTIGQIHVSWCDPHKVRQVTCIGSKMRVCFDDMDQQRPITCFHQGVNIDPQNQNRSIFSDGDIVSPMVAKSEPLMNQVMEFFSACKKLSGTEKGLEGNAESPKISASETKPSESSEKPKVDTKDSTTCHIPKADGTPLRSNGTLGFIVVKIVEAAERSANQGGAPVSLEWK